MAKIVKIFSKNCKMLYTDAAGTTLKWYCRKEYSI